MVDPISGIGRILGKLVVDLGTEVGAHKILAEVADKGKKAITEDTRAKVIEVLLPRDNFPNIWRRHAELDPHHENRFMALLGKIPEASRPKVFAEMEKMCEEQFAQTLTALEHDVVMQVVQRILAKAGTFLQGKRAGLVEKLDEVNKKRSSRWTF